MSAERVCQTCTNDLGWHRRRADHLEATEGPNAVIEFEQDHPEAGGDDD